MSCVSSCARYLLFTFNLLCALCGLGLLILGVLIQLEVQTVKENVDGYIQGIPILLMIVGGITFMIAFDGCCGACKEHRCSLLVYAWSLIVILIIEIVVVVLAFVYSKDLNKQSLRKYFEDYESHRGIIDIIQVLLKCCGADGPQDYGVSVMFQMPRSCCENLDNCSLVSNLFTGLHTRGCVDAIEDFGRYQNYAMTAAVVIGVIEVVGIICAFYLASDYKKRRGYHYQSPPQYGDGKM